MGQLNCARRAHSLPFGKQGERNMRWIVALGLALSAAASWAQVPVDQLAKPPADARRYVIMSTAGKHGEASEWTAADGTKMGRASLVLGGQVWEVDEASRYGPDGMLSQY